MEVTAVIYIDILVGINIYITFFLLLATEQLAHTDKGPLRRGIAASAGGFCSLLILAPELPFLLLLPIRLLMAAALVGIDMGFAGIRIFCKRTLLFFTVNFIFAGGMIALWLVWSPPRLAIRNGMVYYHLSALTLLLSTLLSYGGVRLLEWVLSRRCSAQQLFRGEITVEGRRTVVNVFLDTGNKAHSLSGLPVVFCHTRRLAAIVPAEVLADMEQLRSEGIQQQTWAARTQVIPYCSIDGEGLLMGFLPDTFLLWQNGVPQNCSCIIVPVTDPLSDGEADAIAGEALLKETTGKEK